MRFELLGLDNFGEDCLGFVFLIRRSVHTQRSRPIGKHVGLDVHVLGFPILE